MGPANFVVWCTWEGEHSAWVGNDAPEPAGVPDAVEFARERLGFQADEVQARLLRSGAKRGILNCTRQWGKSTVAAIAVLYRASLRDEFLVIDDAARVEDAMYHALRPMLAVSLH